jgi:histidine triad (HIT) family protein
MKDCLFCKIIEKQIPSKIECENEQFVIIQDINPQAPTHLLVIPKEHVAQISDARDEHQQLLGALVLGARNWAGHKKLEGYRLVFNNGAEAGQTVFHIHLHLLAGRRMKWPPG